MKKSVRQLFSLILTLALLFSSFADIPMLSDSVSAYAKQDSSQSDEADSDSSDMEQADVYKDSNPVTQVTTYWLIFDANGGSTIPMAISTPGSSTSVVVGDISSTIPTRSGYIFYGWSASKNFNSKRIAYSGSKGGGQAPDGSKAVITGSGWTYADYCSKTGGDSSSTELYLYAQWYPLDWRITFDGNGGSCSNEDMVSYGTDVRTTMGDLSKQIPERTGYDFYGWSASSAWSSKRIAYSSSLGGALAEDGSKARTTNIDWSFEDYCDYSGAEVEGRSLTLYAQWQPKTYTIHYDACGGSNAPADQTKKHGETVNLSSQIPVKEGCSFLGWGLDTTQDSPSYLAGDSFKGNFDITFYALWKLDTKTYTITFNGNGGSCSNEDMVKTGTSKATVMGDLSSKIPTRDGYVFYGWSASKSFSSKRVAYSSDTGAVAAEDGSIAKCCSYTWTYADYCSYSGGDSNSTTLTLYAQWQPKTYTIHYDACGGSNAPADQTKKHGETINLSSQIPVMEGYSFLGWGLDSTQDSPSYQAGDSFKGNFNITLYALWKSEIRNYRIVFYKNGGNAAPDMVSVYGRDSSVVIGQIPYCSQARTGYNFYGWSTSSSFSKKRLARSKDYGGASAYDGTIATLTDSKWTYQDYCDFFGLDSSNTTIYLYAQWMLQRYTISYNANGGSGAPAPQIKTYGTPLIVSSQVPVRDGYIFMGWGYSATTMTPYYQPGGEMDDNCTVTLYAVWTQKTYTIKFDGNGASSCPTPSITGKGKDANLTMGMISDLIPTRTGYNFYGWSANPEWNEKRIAYSATIGGKTAGDKSAAVIADSNWTFKDYCEYTGGDSAEQSLTLYAQWQKKTYTVSYYANGGSGAPSKQTKTYGIKLKLRAGIPVRDGYVFKGWAASSGSSIVVYQPGDYYTKNASLKLYAVWELATYTVNYDANGGSGAPEAQVKTHGISLTLSSTIPERSSYDFLGWGLSADSTDVTYQAGDVYDVNEDITLYAVWKHKTYTYKIVFDANGGQGSIPSAITKTGTSNSVIMGRLSSKIPTREGYEFFGWSASSSYSSKRIAYSSSKGGLLDPNGIKAKTALSTWSYKNYLTYSGCSNTKRTLTLYAQWRKARPKLLDIRNEDTGIYFSWERKSTSDCFRVLYKEDNGDWQTACTLKSDYYYLPKSLLKGGSLYTITVQLWDSVNEKALSCYNSTGLSIVWLEPLMASDVKLALESAFYDDGVNVKWKKIEGATGYDIYRAVYDSKGKVLYPTELIRENYGSQFSQESDRYECFDNNLLKGSIFVTNYIFIYTVVPRNGEYVSHGYPVQIKYIEAVKNQKVGNYYRYIRFSWDENPLADGYYVYRKAQTDVTFKKVCTIKDHSVTYYEDTDVSNGMFYEYRVGAYVGSGISNYLYHPTRYYRLLRPVISSVEALAGGKIKVVWKKDATGTGYQVRFRDSKGEDIVVTVEGHKDLSYTSAFTPGETYTVYVRLKKKVDGYTYYSAYSLSKTITAIK